MNENEFAKRMREISDRNINESLWDDKYQQAKQSEKDLRSSLNRMRDTAGKLGIKSYSSIAQTGGDNNIKNVNSAPIGKYQTTEEIGKHFVNIEFGNGTKLEGNFYIVGDINEYTETLSFYADSTLHDDLIARIHFIGSFLKTQKDVDNFYDNHKLDIINTVYNIESVDGQDPYNDKTRQRIKIIRIKRS
ncbi:MAG TPA: hypothetical protein VNX68_19135 [Nitrosopumilaceae archaeon]|nr:hypothetical protein [Nitrosopumilaceae archaeon]